MCCGPQTTIGPVVPIGYICGQTGAHDFFHYTDLCCFPWKSSPPGGCVQNAGRIICSHGCHVCTNHTIRATPLPRSSFPGRLLFIATLDGAWKNVLRPAAYQIVLRRMSWCRHPAGIKWSWNQDLALFAFPHLHRHWPGRALAHTQLRSQLFWQQSGRTLCERGDAVRNPTFAHKLARSNTRGWPNARGSDENFYPGHDKYGQPTNPLRDTGIRSARIQAHRAVSQKMGS